jgi:hypothetical protein
MDIKVFIYGVLRVHSERRRLRCSGKRRRP